MANAVNLYKYSEERGGFVETKAWACGQCGQVADKNYADTYCCVPEEIRNPPSVCTVCGVTGKYFYKGEFCEYCSFDERIKDGKLKLITFEEVPKNLHMPFSDDDDYFEDMESFVESWIDNHSDDPEVRRPKYLTVNKYGENRLDASDIAYSWLEEAYEDAVEDVTKEATAELQKLLDDWCEKQGIVWYEPTSKVIEIDWSIADAKKESA
jgi:hypothetical protein